MAIKMDGHTITALKLKASNGSEVTKQLTEEGTIPTPTSSVSITANGTYDVTDKASAVVAVPAPEINLQTKTATTNGDVVADAGYDGLEKVIVNVSGDVPTLITKSITANGTYPASADNADGYSSVTVNVPAPTPTLQDKTVTENGTYSADSGYDGLGEVVVNVSGDGLKSFRTTTSGSGTIDIDTGVHDLTTASIINVQFICQTASREATDPAYREYAGTITYIAPILSEELEAACSATTYQGGTKKTPSASDIQQTKNIFTSTMLARYFSSTTANNNWQSTWTITADHLTVSLGMSLDSNYTYDVIVHYV